MKNIFYDKKADKELAELPRFAQKAFVSLIENLRLTGRLEFPDAKKLDKNLYEIRVKLQGIFRGFYAYVGNNYIVILHFFHKKTQKTPLKNLKTAKGRLKQYE